MTEPNTTTPVARRRNYGRGHSYEIDGRRVDGVTTILSNGVPKPALIDWAVRETVGYAADHWDELTETPPSKRYRELEQARWNTSKTAMARGTDVHTLAMQLAAGQEVDVPDDQQGFVDSYLKFVDDWQPEEILVEVPVFNRTAGYGGTLDLVARLTDGNTWLLDWKTSKSGIFPETALQLAAYRYAEFYLDHISDPQPMVPVDRCGAVWLRQDGYDLHPTESGEQTFRLFRYAQQVARFVGQSKDEREAYVAESLRPPARETAA